MDVVGKFENAKKIMDECENSQLVLERKKEHIKMAPKFLGNFRAGIQQHLTEKLLHWDKVFDGFPLAYTNVRALQKVGKIISDHTCVHFDVEADYIIFKPVVGQKLIGKVNKIAKRHIGCLVHDHFNAWALHTSSTEKVAADTLIGAEIELTVQEISTSRNIVSIKGKFERFLTPVEEKQDSISINPPPFKGHKRKKKEVDVEVENTLIKPSADNEVNDNETPKKKKKHKKEHEISENGPVETPKEDSQVTVNGDIEIEEESHSETKKKHKKEKKKKEGDDSKVNDVSNMDNSIASLTFCEPLFSSTQIEDVKNESDKKNKKHKKKHKKSNDTNNNGEADLDTLLENDSVLAASDRSSNDGVTVSTDDGVRKHKKAKKRTHEESTYTKLKDSAANQESELSEPSSVKKLKTHVKGTDDDFNSSADFEDAPTSRQKVKKKKKHKDNKS